MYVPHHRWARPLVIAAAALSFSCQKPAPSQPSDPPTVVLGPTNVATVERTELLAGPLLSGTLSARREATLRSEVSGPVRSVNVDAGEEVEEGQLLGEVGDYTLAELAQSAGVAVQSARRALDVAIAEVKRAERLAKAGAVAQRDLDLAIANRAQREAQLAQVQTQKAQADNALARSRVRAPFDGVVSDRMVSMGDVVQPGAPLFKVIDPQSLRLEGSLPIETAGEVKAGTPVLFTVSGYGDRRFQGKVLQVNPAVDPNTRQLRVTVELPNDAGALLAGVFAEGRVATRSHTGLAVPVDAVIQKGTEPTVLRVEGGVVKRVPVKLGLRDPIAEKVEITGGLKEGDLVLRASAGELAEGTKVELTAPETKPEAPRPGVGGSGAPPKEGGSSRHPRPR